MIPWHIDALETDTLSIHLLAERCHTIDEDLQIEDEADEKSRKATIMRAIDRVAEAGLEWAKLPGSTRRGITLTANHSGDNVTINGDEVRIKIDNLPETMKQQSVYIGRPLHEIIDIKGYRDDSLLIRGINRRANDSSITFLINRTTGPARRRI